MANKLKKSIIPKPVDEEKDTAERPARTVRANGNTGKKSIAAPGKFKKDKEEKIDLKKLARDERTWKIIGTISLLISFFLFIAFVSYFFTWKEDQDKVINNNPSFLWDMDDESHVSNLLGRLGAYVSHFFIYRGFGVASLLFCTFFFVSGINLLLNRKVFSVWRNLKYITFGLLIASVSLSFLFSSATFPFGGGVGDMISNWLVNLIGFIGTTVLLLAVAGAYLIWQFNPSFNVAPKTQHPAADMFPDDVEDSTSLSTSGSSVNDTYAGKGNILTGNEKMNYQKEKEEDELELTEVEDEEELINEPGIDKEIVDDILHRDDDRIVRKPTIEKSANSNGSGLELEIKTGAEKKVEEPVRISPAELEPYEPTLDLRDYKYPKLELLETHGSEKIVQDPTELEANKNQIIRTLQNYDITIQKISATVGPTVTLYEIVPAAGVRISRIKNLEDDIALSLAALGIRIIAPIPGKGTIGIEVPNHKKSVVSMKTMLGSEKFTHNNFSLPIAIGKKIDNELFIVDLASMPHLLMAGATGQGKSVGLNAILVSLLYKKHPSQLKLVLIDPKKVELSVYRHIERFFLAKLPGEEDAIITDTKKVVNTLNSLCIEMDNRYDLLKEAGARNIKEYNEKFIKRKLNPQKGHQFLPFIVLVIDEFADLIMTAGKEIEMPIARLAQLARAVGLHLIIATQRPSVNIITGTIKANFPSRIAFKVSSKIDSRTILDAGGAEQLIGKGDMLISHNGEIVRLQCAFVDTPEVERIVDYISEQRGYPQAFMLPEYIDEKEMEGKDFDASDRDPLFEDAARLIVQNQVGSTSLLQRRMKLGYNRAGRLMDQLEAAGIVGANVGSKAREVLYKTEAELLEFLESLR